MSDRPRFARTAGGARVHVTTCRHAQNAQSAVAWTWADEHNSGQIARAVTQMDLQPCHVCKPISTLARWETTERAAHRPTGTAPTTVELLEFERANPGTSGRKVEQIRRLFDITLGRYMQLVIAAVSTEEALLHDAQLAHQIQARIRNTADDRAALLRRNPR